MSVQQYGSTNSRILNKPGERKYPLGSDCIFNLFMNLIFFMFDWSERDYLFEVHTYIRSLKITLYLAWTLKTTLCLESPILKISPKKMSSIDGSACFRSTTSTMNEITISPNLQIQVSIPIKLCILR